MLRTRPPPGRAGPGGHPGDERSRLWAPEPAVPCRTCLTLLRARQQPDAWAAPAPAPAVSAVTGVLGHACACRACPVCRPLQTAVLGRVEERCVRKSPCCSETGFWVRGGTLSLYFTDLPPPSSRGGGGTHSHCLTVTHTHCCLDEPSRPRTEVLKPQPAVSAQHGPGLTAAPLLPTPSPQPVPLPGVTRAPSWGPL